MSGDDFETRRHFLSLRDQIEGVLKALKVEGGPKHANGVPLTMDEISTALENMRELRLLNDDRLRELGLNNLIKDKSRTA